jgi:hypothetical protein
MTTETATGKARASGPRTYKGSPTPRERVLTESLASKVKELTGRDVSPETVRAVRWTTSRWYEAPETRKLFEDMDVQIKRAKAQEKREKAQALLREAESELGDFDDEEDSESDDDTYEDVGSDDVDEEEDEDVFDETEKVSASF